MWGDDIMPKYPTKEEEDGILEYVRKNPGASVEWPGYTCYFVQHVISANNKYSYKDRNNTLHDNIDGSTNLNELQIKENNGNYTHVNNFNSGKCENAATHMQLL